MEWISIAQLRRASVVTLAVLAGACDTQDKALVAPLVAKQLQLELQLSSFSAAPGEQVALAFSPEFTGDLGGFQGYLRFDSNYLRYIGQSADASDIILVNAKRADRGELRLAAMNAQGMRGAVGTLVFEVLRSSYTQHLNFDVEEAATNRNISLIRDVNVLRWVRESAAIRVPSAASQMSVDDWSARLEPDAPKGPIAFAIPGEYRPDLRYGDINLSGGAPTVSDALASINASVGVNELIIGTNSPALDQVIAGNVFPFNTPGCGESTDPLRPGYITATDPGEITLSDALAIINEAVGVNQACVGDQIPGRPTTLPSNRIVVTGSITTSTTWTKNNIYELNGFVFVSGGATLTIEPGTLIEGSRGTTPGTVFGALFIQRDGRLIADGTVNEPIVMTCTGTPKAKGCWGGLVVNGNAPTNEGTQTSPANPRPGDAGIPGNCFEAVGEGTSGLYGGCNPADSSGVLRYLRLEYSGFRYTTTNELNGLALQGVGNKTVVDYIQVHAGQDDGFEVFGGTVNLKHLVITAASDDGLDWVGGWKGSAQFVIVQADSGDGDKGIEADNTNTLFDASPRSTPTVWNMTIIGKLNPASTFGVDQNNNVEGGMHIRRGTRPNLGNFIIAGYPHILDLDDTSTCVNDATGGPISITAASYMLYTTVNNTDTGDPAGCGSEEVFLAAGASNSDLGSATLPALKSAFNVIAPDFRPLFGASFTGLTPPAGLDQTATYKGAVAPANSSGSNIPWYSGWTRPWATATTP